MDEKKNALPGARPKGLGKRSVDGRDQQQQYKHLTRFEQHKNSPEAYRCAVRRLFADAFIMSLDWPRRMRFSWRVDRHGRLRPLTADEGGAR